MKKYRVAGKAGWYTSIPADERPPTIPLWPRWWNLKWSLRVLWWKLTD